MALNTITISPPLQSFHAIWLYTRFGLFKVQVYEGFYCTFFLALQIKFCKNILVPVPSQELDFQRHMSWSFLFFVFNELRREVIVRFVDISWIVDHHSLSFLTIILSCNKSNSVQKFWVCSQWVMVRGDCLFVDINGIDDHRCLYFLFIILSCNKSNYVQKLR